MAIFLKNSWNVPPARWGPPADVQYAIKVNAEEIYGYDSDSEVLIIPGFWGLPTLDYSKYGNHGINHGATYKNGSFDFDGNDYVDCGTSLININKDFSLSARININDIAHNSYSVMAASIDASTHNSYWILIHRADKGGICWQHDLGTGGAIITTPSIDLTPNSQQQVTLVRNQTSGNLKIYLDNIVITDEDINPTFDQSTGHEYPIGAWSVYTPGNFFNGSISEARISKEVRTPDQVALFKALPYGLYQKVKRPFYLLPIAPTGWTGKINGVTNPSKINGISVANITKVNGIASS